MSSTIDMVNKPSIYKKPRNTTNSYSYNDNEPTTNTTTNNPDLNGPPPNDIFSKPPVMNDIPIDISKSNIYANCDQKCSFSFSYSQTLLVAKNNNTQLTFLMEQNPVPPVTYNNMKYNASSFSLFTPSLHKWNGANTDAEIIIEHIPVLGGKYLYVCIPIVKSNAINSPSSSSLSEIIHEASKHTPANGEITNLTISNFTLQNIVPNAPFYSYYGENTMFQGDFIVYDKIQNIPLTNETISLVSSMIQGSTVEMFGGNLYYNPLGTNQTETDIYISCQPTGFSDEKINNGSSTSNFRNQSKNDLSSFLNSQIVMILFICLFFILCIFLLNYVFNKFTGIPVNNFIQKMTSSTTKS